MNRRAQNQTMQSLASGMGELKSRLLFVLLGILVYRIGSHITIPGVDPVQLAHMFAKQQHGVLGFFNMFSGGALSRMTIFALGVMPYISASIIIQLMTSIVPSLEQLKKEGEMGQRKISQYTRYGTVFLSLFQAMGLCRWLAGQQHVVMYTGVSFYFVAALTLVTGTMFLMWLGEQMTERGIGNGISILIFSGIVSRLPSALGQVLIQVRQGQMKMIFLLMLVLLVIAVVMVVVYIEKAQRRIPIHYARRQQGNKLYQVQNTHLPLKINTAGVIPPIFATSIIVFPSTLLQYFTHGQTTSWVTHIALMLQPGQPLYLICFSVAIIFFCFFYTALVFNSKETAMNLKKSGAFIPSIRPGEQTGHYIDKVLTRLTFAGSIYLTLIALMPSLLILFWHVPFYFGGTSLLIIVVVLLDFMTQAQTLLMSSQYQSVMKKANMRTLGGGLPTGRA